MLDYAYKWNQRQELPQIKRNTHNQEEPKANN